MIYRTRYIRFKFLVFTVFIIFGCENYKIEELYQQRIPDSSLVIYDFFAGGIYTDSSIYGYAILDSTKKFLPSNVDRLPLVYFKNIPNKSLLEVVNLVKPNGNENSSLSPIRRYTINKNIKINVEEYISFIGSSSIDCSLRRLEFNSFSETNDSIIFYEVKDIDRNHINTTSKVSYRKGNIKIIEFPENTVSRIEIKDLIIDYGDIIESNQIDSIIHNNPIICLKTYYLIPKNKVYSCEFSDYGIFKKIN